MKKYFGLSNREETALRFLNYGQKWVDGTALVLLNVMLFAAAIGSVSKFDFAKILKNFVTSEEITIDGKKSQNLLLGSKGKAAFWIVSIILLIRASVYFAKMYLESKIVSDYEGTEGIERN